MTSTLRIVAATLTALLFASDAKPAAAGAPGDLALLVTHEMHSTGADGIARTSRFSDRVIRQKGTVWIQRVVPDELHDNKAHGAGERAHKHLDLAASAQWIEKSGESPPRLRLVNSHSKLVVDVPPAEYANVGFDGQWNTAFHLLDPASLAKLKASTRQAPAGTRWYEGGTASNYVRVLWDEAEKYPHRIESGNSNGTSHSQMVAERRPMPPALPWAKVGAYRQKDYSDFLD